MTRRTFLSALGALPGLSFLLSAKQEDSVQAKDSPVRESDAKECESWGLTIALPGTRDFHDLARCCEGDLSLTGWGWLQMYVGEGVHALPPRYEDGRTLFDFVSSMPFSIADFQALRVHRGAPLPWVNYAPPTVTFETDFLIPEPDVERLIQEVLDRHTIRTA